MSECNLLFCFTKWITHPLRIRKHHPANTDSNECVDACMCNKENNIIFLNAADEIKINQQRLKEPISIEILGPNWFSTVSNVTTY